MAGEGMTRQTRLRFHLRSQGALWYHVQASTSHVLIDPQAEARALAPGFVRPIELWRAPRWHRPPSLNTVRGNNKDSPGDAPPAAGDVINLSSVVDFVSDVSSLRLGALGALIDAVAAALDGGPPVVLAAPDADQGALWIGAVSFFASPQACLRLSFSTHERWDDVLALVATDDNDEGWSCPVLSVVPQSDVDRLTRRDELPVVVIDPRVEATRCLVAGVEHRRTQLGQLIKVTDWSRLALNLCCEDYTALERCLRARDKIRPVEAMDLAGSLAAAVPLVDGLRLASALVTELPLDETERAWQRLRSALDAQPPHANEIHVAFVGYLRLALADDSWLARRPPPLPAAAPRPVDPDLPARLIGPLTTLAHRLTHDLPHDDPVGDVRCGVLMLRSIDFAHRIARLIGGLDLGTVGIGRLAERAAEVLLDGVAGVRVAAVVGPLDGAALARWIFPLLSDAGELPAPVIALLAGAVDSARLIASTRADPLVAEPVALQVAVATASGRIAGDPRLRGPAVEYLLHRAARTYPDADPGPMVAEAFGQGVGDEPWEASALLRLVERAPVRFGAELVPIVVAYLPDWLDDPLSARLAAVLLKRIPFVRAHRAGTTDAQAQLLNLLAATGPGWLQADDGLCRRAAEILMWADQAWAGLEAEVRQLIAPRVTVAAFQVALAAEPAQSTTVLRGRLGVTPVGSRWRSAVEIGLEPALPMLAEVLRLNRYRLAGELVIVSTRATLEPEQEPTPVDLPRVSMLPVEPVIDWLIAHEDRPELEEHLVALADQERALAGVPTTPGPESGPEPILEEVLQVALGLRDAAGRPLRSSGLAGLLATPAGPSADDSRTEAEPPSFPARSRWWWWRWIAR